jgi:ribosomal protein S9
VREFLKHLIDYAGMFPPASLSLDKAIQNYAAYLKSDNAWMLARFVCFASQLAELDAYAEWFDENAPLKISALGVKNPTRENFRAQFETTRAQIAMFNARWDVRGCVDAAEIAIPGNFDEIYFLGSAWVKNADSQKIKLFVEIPFDSEWAESVPRVLDALATQHIGFKLRTGGVVASAFPSTAQIARAIIACRERGVRMKCTAGLHHPLRKFDASVKTEMHGFVNVFGAGILAHARGLDENVVREILEEEEAKHFCFDENGFAWRDVRATNAEIARARREAMISFGSCSFDEPREDLRALGWL